MGGRAMSGKKLPKGWRLRRLSEVLSTLESGSRPRGGVGGLTDGIPSIGGEHLNDSGGFDFSQIRYVPSDFYRKMRRGIIQVGDILLVKDGATTGKVSLVTPDWRFADSAVNEHVFILRPTRELVSSFLFYYLYGPAGQHQIKKTFHGSAQGGINQSFAEHVNLPVPPLPVQERIVQILQKADEIRRKRREALELADKILPALFLEMFGDPATNPKGWNLVPLGDVLSVIRNGTTAEQNIQQLGYPVTRIETISHGVINPDRVRWVQIDQEALEKWRLHHGDILFSHINSSEHIGKTAMYLGTPPDLVHGMNLLLLRADPNKCLPIYLFVYLRLQSVRDKLRSMARQAVNQASLNQTQIRSFPVMLPPLELQRKLELAVDQNQLALSRLAGMSEEADMLFQNLLSRAFTGELTAEWEAANAEEIAAQQAFYERLPRLLVFALIAEKAKRAGRAAAEVLVTALMKYAFLLQMEGNGGRRRLYHFVPYHYGPFAKELYADLKKLQAEGLVTVDNDSEEEKTRIALADPTKAEQALAELPDDLKEDVAAIIENYGRLHHNALLKAVYEKYPAYARKSRLKRRTRGS
jgi:type I restriction enzyme S subunit